MKETSQNARRPLKGLDPSGNFGTQRKITIHRTQNFVSIFQRCGLEKCSFGVRKHRIIWRTCWDIGTRPHPQSFGFCESGVEPCNWHFQHILLWCLCRYSRATLKRAAGLELKAASCTSCCLALSARAIKLSPGCWWYLSLHPLPTDLTTGSVLIRY